MPELPEVETVARGLRQALVGRRLLALELRRASIFKGDAAALGAMEGTTLTGVARGGKYLVLELHDGDHRWQLLIHLGMTGQLLVQPAGAPRQPHTHAVLAWDDGRELHFRDPRRFGRMALAPEPAHGFAPELGVAAGAEPLAIGPEAFVELFRGRQAPIKNALMNQKLLRGLCNIYADESLFRAGLDPRARAVSRARLLRLRLAIRAVLREAIAAGGSSISDYVGSDGEPGWFHLRHRVYGRTGQPCPRCRRAIHRIVLAGRSAHFCPACQKK